MHCDFVGVGLPEPGDSTHLRLYAVDFPESKGFIREETPIPIEGTPPGKAFKTGEPFVATAREIADMTSDSPASAEGFAAGCVLPRLSRRRLLGVVFLIRRDGEPFRPSQGQFLMVTSCQEA